MRRTRARGRDGGRPRSGGAALAIRGAASIQGAGMPGVKGRRRGSWPWGLVSSSSSGRSSSPPAVPGGPSYEEPPELAGPVEPDKDLAEQPLVARRLAAGPEDLHGGGEHGRGGLAGGERAGFDSLRGREQPGAPGPVGVATPAGLASNGTVAPGSGAGRQGGRPPGSAPPPPPTSSSGSESRASESRSPAPTPPRTAAASASGPPCSSRRIARASRARCGATASRERRNEAACQRPRRADRRTQQRFQGKEGRCFPPQRPARPVRYAAPRRSWLKRGGGWPRTSRMRGRGPGRKQRRENGVARRLMASPASSPGRPGS